jgi:membrane protein
MIARLKLPIGVKTLAARTIRGIMRDDVMGLSAELSFYVVLALFPLLACLIALARLFLLENFVDATVNALAPFVPAAGLDVIRDFMTQGGDTSVIGVSFLLALWSASTPFTRVTHVMNRTYRVVEHRPWWRLRLLAVFLSVGLSLFALASFALIVFGPELGEWIAGWFGLSEVFVLVWKILQWPVAFVLVATGIAFVYYFAPNVDQDWVWITPGSIFATLCWFGASLGFRFYAVNFGHYEATYGALGGMMLLLMWCYLSGIALLAGAELNAVIERASPWHLEAGPHVPGQRVAIGARAERQYLQRLQEQGRQPEES